MKTKNMSRLTVFAKSLRKNSTETEKLLWRHLRTKQLHGLKFRRQEIIGDYIVDFVCYAKKIVIELDGGQHAEEKNKLKDQVRDQWLRNQGFVVLRFWDNEVLRNIAGVWEEISTHCFPSP